MIITKTKFINYTRCPRYVALEEIKKNKKINKEIIELIKKEEYDLKVRDILLSMYELNEEDDEVIDLIDIENSQLKAMLRYYKQVEELATKRVNSLFGGNIISSENTQDQKYFTYELNDNNYICYLDVYNETEHGVNIIETKATTSNGYLKLVSGEKDNKYSIFTRKDNIYYLKEDIPNYDIEKEMKLTKYNEQRNKLLDRYGELGKYVYDLAVQRFIIEGSKELKEKKVNYYLAVLNHEYVFDGTMKDNEPVYSDDIVVLFNFNKITEEYQKIIKDEVMFLEDYINKEDNSPVKLGEHCCYKGTSECKFFKAICGKHIPKTNSSLTYMNNGHGFKDEFGDNHKGLDLINEGYLKLLDIPELWIRNPNHFIQRNAVEFNKEYINKERIKEMLGLLKYPLYHLDFETFNCPLPRFKGEKCYSQSVFEFSLHIEHSKGLCDKDKDNYIFLAKDFNDCREELVKKLCELIKPDGTLIAQNASFERSRIKELSDIFPAYKNELLKIRENYFDLIYFLRGNKAILESLGYDKEESGLVNYYHKDLSGSYSIKKTLPVFSDLSYANLDVHNGIDAIVAYANYPYMSRGEFNKTYEALSEYCKQDTWAMVVILDELRKKIGNEDA